MHGGSDTGCDFGCARPRLATWYFEPTRTGWRLVLIGNKDPTAPIQDAPLYEAIVPSFAAAVSAWRSVRREGRWPS